MKPLLLLLLAGLGCLRADDLTTRDGDVYRNYTVTAHDAGYITIMYADGGGKIPLSELPADLQARYGYDPVKAAAFVARDVAEDREARQEVNDSQQQAGVAAAAPAAAPRTARVTAAPAPLTGMAAKMGSELMTMEAGQPQDFDAHKLAGVKYFAFYYSASWCPPCRAFTPTLVDFYKSFKPSHPDFELILVGDDRTEDALFAYMRNDDMPWPAVKFSDFGDPDLRRYCGNGIPCLVLVDADGKVLSDTYRGGQYMGPEVVVDDIKSMVK